MDQPVKILVVDDQCAILRATCRIVEAAGYTTLAASSGAEALRLVGEQKPDLVLLDVGLPDISGFEICKQIKADARLRGIFVVIVSAQHTDSSSLSEALETGADGYITRPISNRELLARVQAMLRIHATETALRQSEERFRTMTDFTQDWEYWVGPERQFIYISPSCETVCGYAAREFREDPDMLLKIIHPVDRGALQEHEETFFQSRQPGSLEMRIITRSGEVRWIQHICRPVYAADGRWLGRRASNRDITGYKQAEEALERQNRTLRFLQEISLDISGELEISALLHNIMQHAVDLGRADRGGGIYLYEADKRLLRLVEGAGINKDRVGITVGENEGVAGHVYRTARPLVVDNYTRWEERADVLVASPPSTVMGLPLLIKGQVIGVLTLIANSLQRTFTEEDTRLAGMFAAKVSIAIQNAQLYGKAQEEIDERKRAEEVLKESEQRFRSIIENTAAGYFFVGRDGLWKQVNQAWLQMHGFASADEVIGRHFSLTQVGMDLEQANKRVKGLLEGEIIKTGEASRRYKDGSTGYHSFSANPVIQGGEVVGLEGFIIDTTGHKHAEEALQKSHERLRTLTFRLAQEEESQRRSMARDLHDRVGQNLTALHINLNIIRGQLSPDAGEKVTARLDEATQLVEEMINHVGDVMATLRPPLLDDYGLLAALRQYAEQFVRRTGLRVEVVEPGQPFRRPSLDVETTLFRVAQEGLNNVAKHAGASQVTLRLEADGQIIRLFVADDGHGFDLAEVARDEKISGWGLTSMRERIESIGGSLQLLSEPGKGTLITVEIPDLSRSAAPGRQASEG